MLTKIFEGKNYLIVGGGVTGSAVFRVLTKLGATATIVDEQRLDSPLIPTVSLAQALEGQWEAAVISPGWRPAHPFIQALQANGLELISEVDLAWKIRSEIRPHQKWLGVTGTNGKTTTVEMAAAMLLQANFSVAACGNLGDAVIEAVIDEANFEYLVVELSSFQLQWSENPRFIASAILNIADDHLDWHGTFEDYTSAKLRILSKSNLAILNGDDATVLQATQSWTGKKVFFTLGSPREGEMGVVEDLVIDRAFVGSAESAEVICELGEIVPFAAHSVSNTLAAAGLAMAVGVEPEVVRKAISLFRPGRHRIETVLERGDIKWINDSKATNPHAALASIKAFRSIIWIAGGLAKGANMAELVKLGKGHLKSAILFGQDRDLIGKELMLVAPHIPITNVDLASDAEFTLMESAVVAAKELAQAGDVVLLAPACASMDQFLDYADRGDQFCAAVMKIVGQE